MNFNKKRNSLAPNLKIIVEDDLLDNKTKKKKSIKSKREIEKIRERLLSKSDIKSESDEDDS